jgi:hypothetical protein
VTVEKARAALDAARLLDIDGVEPDAHGLPPIVVADQYNRLLVIAQVQAAIAAAEELAGIREALAAIAHRQHADGRCLG